MIQWVLGREIVVEDSLSFVQDTEKFAGILGRDTSLHFFFPVLHNISQDASASFKGIVVCLAEFSTCFKFFLIFKVEFNQSCQVVLKGHDCRVAVDLYLLMMLLFNLNRNQFFCKIQKNSLRLCLFYVILFHFIFDTIRVISSMSNSGRSVWHSQKYLQYAHLKLGLPSSVYLECKALRIKARSAAAGNSA